MNACASSSSGPPIEAEPPFYSTDEKLISKAHVEVIRGKVSNKRSNLASLSLSSEDVRMKAAMENKSPHKKKAQKKPSYKKRKKSNKKTPSKKKVENEQERLARLIRTAQRSYKCKHLLELRTNFVTKITMERYNSNPDVLKVESKIFDTMYGKIKDLEVNKSISFHDLLIFGNDNVGMYLFYYYL